jgi:hypothetical protein
MSLLTQEKVYIYMYLYIFIYIYIYMYVCKYKCMLIHTYMYAYMYVYIYIYTYTYIYKYIHTYMQLYCSLKNVQIWCKKLLTISLLCLLKERKKKGRRWPLVLKIGIGRYAYIHKYAWSLYQNNSPYAFSYMHEKLHILEIMHLHMLIWICRYIIWICMYIVYYIW